MLRHLDAAGAAAGDDLLSYLQLADPLMTGYKSAPFDLAKAMQLPAAAPAKAFDNLFFLGSGWVSPWAIRTNDGIVLIDEEGERIIAGGMRRLGARPGANPDTRPWFESRRDPRILSPLDAGVGGNCPAALWD